MGQLAGAILRALLSMGWFAAAAAEPPASAIPPKVRWQHPAGLVSQDTLSEIKGKLETQDWARNLYASRKRSVEPWLKIGARELREVFPKQRGNVYHNFSCPQDRCRLSFSAFDVREFKCPVCGKAFAPETDSGVYTAKDRYHGTMYEGWVCLFHLTSSEAATDLGILSRIEAADGPRYADRAIEILLLYADVLEKLPTKFDSDPQFSVLLTYHREGDNKVLNDLAVAYELVRDRMTAEQRSGFERLVLRRMLNDLMLERIYTYNHNNVYQWHRTILQVGLALERADLIDWSYGFGDLDPAKEPDHHSIRKILATHFKPDGAFWEMCSGYHLYPLSALCELAILSRNLARMDPTRFPASQYDLTDAGNPGYRVLENALHWFMSLAPPDRVMLTVGDSMAPRGGMADYYPTAEAGYRYYGLKEVGDYPQLREGRRSWAALLYGAPQITQSLLPYTSSYLSSGWVSLRNEWQGNRVWLGLNALIPGGGHQHADRLTLLSFSHGQLLALEKATPYNESVTRVLGTRSPSHNTVTVDLKSQKQGEALQGAEIPKVAYFLTSPIAQFAELQADHLYSHTRVYRRSVALIEDFYVDLFRVEGGTNCDWLLHHSGPAPKFSLPMKEGSFTPIDWLANGSGQVRLASAGAPWEATWSVQDVTSRLTMLGAEPSTVYSLETYPVDNAVITPPNPPCQTLCVRRPGATAAFLAVGDAWQCAPNLQSVVAATDGQGLALKSKTHTYHLLFGPGQARFSDGVTLTSDAAFALWRDTDALMLVHGKGMEIEFPKGPLQVRLDEAASLVAEVTSGAISQKLAGDIEYDTYGGVDHHRPAPKVKVTLTGALWPALKPGAASGR
jgi:hypothetical protein